MLALIAWAFTLGIYVAARAQPSVLQHAPIAIVDGDCSQLSARIAGSFYPPHINMPVQTTSHDADLGLDSGRFSFALEIPPNFQRDVDARRMPSSVQLNVDATLVSQAFIGVGYIQ